MLVIKVKGYRIRVRVGAIFAIIDKVKGYRIRVGG